MVRLREKAEKKRVVLCCAWGALPGFSDRRRNKADRGEKSALLEGDRARGRELGGRTDEVYTKVVQEGRQVERNTAAEIVCG